MHPSISLMLRDPRTRRAIERELASRGQHGDTMIAHINPAEAVALKRMGGAGTINPKTGLRQFWEDGGGAGNSAGHADPGHPGGSGGNGGGNGGGYNGQGRGWGALGTTGGDLGPGQTRPGVSAFQAANAAYTNRTLGDQIVNGLMGLASFGDVEPNLADSATYAAGTYHTGFNPGSVIGGALGLGLGAPGPGALGGWGYHALGGGAVVVGGPGAPATQGMDRNAGLPGANGANMSNGLSGGGSFGRTGQNGGSGNLGGQIGPGAPGGGSVPAGQAPAPGARPAGMPAIDPVLANLYLGGTTADPFAGRFGVNPGLLPYLIAAGQPQGAGFMSGMLR